MHELGRLTLSSRASASDDSRSMTAMLPASSFAPQARSPRASHPFRVIRGISGLGLLVAIASASSLIAQDRAKIARNEARLFTETRQLTLEGRRSGEGYYSRDGSMMVFQSERRKDNPFYQIYLMDLETGDVEPVSPGHGKTTCAWIHPDKQRVLYASTHSDPEARKKQKAELDFRASGKERRYAWDYDRNFEIWSWNRKTKKQTRLTFAPGYDAEGSYSPDGEWIAFASNRSAYLEPISDADRKLLELDKSLFMELYLMRADGSQVRRLTFTRGYDGGPFFSHDGKKVCWRRFSENGLTAEVFTKTLPDGPERQLTSIKAMSWAPYFHPSGEYLIFTTNRHGFSNFELYLVDKDGAKEPVRVTWTPGFDGLPTFSPDGKTLSWTSNRTKERQSQIFVANWKHEEAMRLLASSPARGSATSKAASKAHGASVATTATVAAGKAAASLPAIRAEDLRAHVETLASEKFGGRFTGSEGERLATEHVARAFERAGLKPAGDDDSWYQPFEARVLLMHAKREKVKGRNVLGKLVAPTWGNKPAPILVVGAHIDHLGSKGGLYSRAQGKDKNKIHFGADDNASGVAALIEIAEWLGGLAKDGKFVPKRTVVFAAWSGEEVGLFGSRHYIKQLQKQNDAKDLRGVVAAYLNLDMVGRFNKQLILSGIGSSSVWKREIERRNAPVGLPISLVDDVNLRTDTTSFYSAKVPILGAFTGAHADYHKPSDTADKVDFASMQKIARLMALITRGLALNKENPDFIQRKVETAPVARAGKKRPYLGTIPDYAESKIPGVPLSGVTEGAPAHKAGMRAGDVLVELAGQKISNIHDYVKILDKLEVDKQVKCAVVRGGKRVELEITPRARS